MFLPTGFASVVVTPEQLPSHDVASVSVFSQAHHSLVLLQMARTTTLTSIFSHMPPVKDRALPVLFGVKLASRLPGDDVLHDEIRAPRRTINVSFFANFTESSFEGGGLEASIHKHRGRGSDYCMEDFSSTYPLGLPEQKRRLSVDKLILLVDNPLKSNF